MAIFAQPIEDPFPEDPLVDPFGNQPMDPRYPLDPFDAMLNAFGLRPPGIFGPGNPYFPGPHPCNDPFGYPPNPLGPNMPGSPDAVNPNFPGPAPANAPFEAQPNTSGPNPLQNTNDLNHYDHIPPESQDSYMDNLAKRLAKLEDSIENSTEPPDPETEEAELFKKDPGWSLPTPNIETDGGPPIPDEETHGVPMRPELPRSRWHDRQIGSCTGVRNDNTRANDLHYCRTEKDLVSTQICENCEHFDQEIEACLYHQEYTDSDNDENETNENSILDDQDGEY